MEHQQAAQSLHRRDASGSGASNTLRRSWHVLADLMPFSSTALASLPKDLRIREREVRADRIPINPDARDYGATGVTLPPNVRVPKKIATPIKVEGKVWLASERSNHSTRPRVLSPRAEPFSSMDLISEHLTSPRYIVPRAVKCCKRRCHQKIRHHVCGSQCWDSGEQQTFVRIPYSPPGPRFMAMLYINNGLL